MEIKFTPKFEFLALFQVSFVSLKALFKRTYYNCRFNSILLALTHQATILLGE